MLPDDIVSRLDPRLGFTGLRKSIAWAPAMNSMARIAWALSMICRVLRAVVMPMLTKSSWSAAAGMEPVAAGADRTLFSQTRPRRILCEHQTREHACALGQECGQADAEMGIQKPVEPTFREHGRGGHDHTTSSRAKAIGTPWKLAPVRTICSSGKNTGLSAAPLSSISNM